MIWLKAVLLGLLATVVLVFSLALPSTVFYAIMATLFALTFALQVVVLRDMRRKAEGKPTLLGRWFKSLR